MNHLTIDIGNTDVVFGYWSKDKTEPNILRISTKAFFDKEDTLKEQIAHAIMQWDHTDQTEVIISSVVPMVTDLVYHEISSYHFNQVKFLNPITFKKLPIEILRPDQIGADLVANALAAFTLYHQDTIIVDFGTAMSFTTIDRNGKILGVSIAPGLQTAIKSLTSNTSQLFEVPLEMPPSSLGLNTTHAIQSGIMYGYDGLVRGMISTQEKELHRHLTVIATGGLSQKILTLQDRVDYFEPFLTLKGLQIACDLI